MRYEVERVVVGIATVHDEDPLLAVALDLAERLGAELHLVHSFELHSPSLDVYARLGYMDTRAPREYEDGVRERMESQVRRREPRIAVRCHAAVGSAGRVLQEVAREVTADLIVVGPTRRGPFSRTLLGTTAERTLRGATCPVLVAKRPLPAHLERVLLTTDLSPSTATVHEVGLDLVESLFRGDQPLLHSLSVVWHRADMVDPLAEEALMEEGLDHLEEFLTERGRRARPVTGVVRVGDPTREIAAEVAEWSPDLLILGTHARVGVPRLAFGSIAEAAVRGVPCNVLVIPPGACDGMAARLAPDQARDRRAVALATS